MSIEKFEEMTVKYLKEQYGFDTEIIVKDVYKNNGLVLRGVTVVFDDANACPTVYLEDLYKDFCKGKTFEEVMEELVNILEKSRIEGFVDVSFFEDYELIKDRVVYKLINTEKNLKLLSDVPHMDFLDLSIVFYVIVTDKTFGSGSIMIQNRQFERWNISLEELFEAAKVNTIKRLGSSITSIEDVLLEMIRQRNESEFDEIEKEIEAQKKAGRIIPMYVLSNQLRINGAACMLDMNLLRSFAEDMDSDFYILPSSVHELILIPQRGVEDPYCLERMVKEVNISEVGVTDVLSDHVYRFSREKCAVECI